MQLQWYYLLLLFILLLNFFLSSKYITKYSLKYYITKAYFYVVSVRLEKIEICGFACMITEAGYRSMQLLRFYVISCSKYSCATWANQLSTWTKSAVALQLFQID